MVLAGYSVETGTCPERKVGRNESFGEMRDCRQGLLVTSPSAGDGTCVQHFGRLLTLYVGVVCGASRDSREQLRSWPHGVRPCVGILPDRGCALVILRTREALPLAPEESVSGRRYRAGEQSQAPVDRCRSGGMPRATGRRPLQPWRATAVPRQARAGFCEPVDCGPCRL